jgi:DHA2 family multidrug resistance protein-like MFS transporter
MGVFVAFGYFLFIAQYLQLVRGLSPLYAGLLSLPSAIAFVVSSNVAPKFIRRFRPASVLSVCLVVAAVALVMLLAVGPTSGLVVLVGASVVVSLAMAPMFSLTTELVVGTAPPERAGAASAISETGAEIGGAVGIAVLGSIGTAVYRGVVAAGLPSGLPAEAAAVALDTLGGAVSVAGQLPPATAGALLSLTRDAFVQGLHVVAGISAVIAVAAASIAAFLLRRVTVGGPSADHAAGPSGDPHGPDRERRGGS